MPPDVSGNTRRKESKMLNRMNTSLDDLEDDSETLTAPGFSTAHEKELKALLLDAYRSWMTAYCATIDGLIEIDERESVDFDDIATLSFHLARYDSAIQTMTKLVLVSMAGDSQLTPASMETLQRRWNIRMEKLDRKCRA